MTTPTRFERILNAPKNTKIVKNRRTWTRKVARAEEPVEPPKSFEDKLRDDDYMCKLPWPSPKDPQRSEKQREYTREQSRLEAQFKADMFANYGVTGHPKAQRAYEIAWSHGHAAGFAEVDIYFSELAELLQP